MACSLIGTAAAVAFEDLKIEKSPIVTGIAGAVVKGVIIQLPVGVVIRVVV